jgi:hypothetical protein
MASLSYQCFILSWLCFKLSCSRIHLREERKKQLCQVTTQGFSNKYMLTVDASDAGVSAVLLHERKDDIDLPNCYYS